MIRQLWQPGVVALAALSLACAAANAQTYFFVGPSGGDFFDEANWNTAADGTGVSPVGDLIPDDSGGAIALDLVIDGDTVEAAGQVDFGTGSLTLDAGSFLSITGNDNDLDINSDSTFSMTDATLSVFDIANFEGVSIFNGGSVTSVTDDIAFQDNFVNLAIDGTTFTAFDNIYFDGFNGSIANAVFDSGDRLGVRNEVQITMVDTFIEINEGTGDIDSVFGVAGAGSTVTLTGRSTLIADSVEEGADLVLLGTTVAQMGGQGERLVFPNELLPPEDDDSTITVGSFGVTLEVVNSLLIDVIDSREFLINGFTGLTYADDSSTWNVTDWNGFDPVTLRVVPEPVGAALAIVGLTAIALSRRQPS